MKFPASLDLGNVLLAVFREVSEERLLVLVLGKVPAGLLSTAVGLLIIISNIS